MKKILPFIIVIVVLMIVIVCLIHQNTQLTQTLVAQSNSNSVDNYVRLTDQQEQVEERTPIGFKIRQQES